MEMHNKRKQKRFCPMVLMLHILFLSSTSPITEICTSNHLLLDLNTESCLEDDTNVEEHMSHGITFLLYSSCIWLILSYR